MTPSVSLQSRDWWTYPNWLPGTHFNISVSAGGFQVDGAYLPYGTTTGEITNIVITGQILTSGDVNYTYTVNGPLYGGERLGARLTDGSVVPLEQANIKQVDAPVDLAPTPVPDPTPEPTPTPTPDPTPTPEPEPTPTPTPTPDPSPTPPPTPTPTPEPTPDSSDSSSTPSNGGTQPSNGPSLPPPRERPVYNPEPVSQDAPSTQPTDTVTDTTSSQEQSNSSPEQSAPTESTTSPTDSSSSQDTVQQPESTPPVVPVEVPASEPPVATDVNSLPDDTPLLPDPSMLEAHVQEDKSGVLNGGQQMFGTKTQPQVIGEDGKLTPPPPPPGSGLPIPPDAITIRDTFIGQPGGTTFNSPDVAIPVEPITVDVPIPGAQAIANAYVAMANIGNDMSPITRKKAKKILVTTVVVAAVARRRLGK